MSRYGGSGLVPFSHPLSNWWREPDPTRWDFSHAPARIADQHFGLGLLDDDLQPPALYNGFYVRPRRQITSPRTTGLSEVRCADGRFQVNLDVNQFTPGELVVKTVDNSVIVHGKHEEKVDEHGFVSREFTRRYVIPKDVLPENVTSSLSQDGILTIEAPIKALEEPKANERVVSINRQPSVVEQPAEAI